MGSKKPPKHSTPRPTIIWEHLDQWIRKFIVQLEENYLETGRNLSPDASFSEYQLATIRAMLRTLRDSGMDSESLVETIGYALIKERSDSIEWNSDLNQRRFELIDKQIQETLTPSEKFELAGLTGIMREQLETEANLPLEGAKALHRQLLKLPAKDKPE
jgi:hypothetical protein